MKVCEMFKSIQGEGRLIGVVSVLIHLWGCNLRCKWCDEKKCLKKGEYQEMTLSDIISKMGKYHCKHIIISGGEPMLSSEISQFTKMLKLEGYHITVETNGTIVKKDLAADLISMSPKLLNSVPDYTNPEQFKIYNERRLNIKAIKFYMKNFDYQVKFVVEDESDSMEVEKIISELREVPTYDEEKILMMPLSSSRRELFKVQKRIAELCIKKGYRYGNRLHLQIWGKCSGR